MSTHSEAHCKKPSLRFKREGTLWRCDCGQYWYVTYVSGYDFLRTTSTKSWRNCTDTYKNSDIRALERRQDSYQSKVDSLRRDYDQWTKKVFEAFDQVSKDVQEIQQRITELENKKVTRGKPASKQQA